MKIIFNRSFFVFFFVLFLFTLPVHSKVSKDENVIYFPAYASAVSANIIKVNIHGWIFEPADSDFIGNFIMNEVKKNLLVKYSLKNGKIFYNRLKWFFVDNERNKVLEIKLGDKIYSLNPSEPDGHFKKSIEIKKSDLNFRNKKVLFYSQEGKRKFLGEILFVKKNGHTVISDIDDTIKISNVLDKKKLIKNTFINEFKNVKGMASLYREFAKKGAFFNYVSGSPWQLYVPIKEFIDRSGFPNGVFYLKNLRVKDSSFINFINSNQFEFKYNIIKSIINEFPERKYILIGDSGEKDPEVYASLAKEFPGKVLSILIREVETKQKNKIRYNELFKDINKSYIKVFIDTKEINFKKIKIN